MALAANRRPSIASIFLILYAIVLYALNDIYYCRRSKLTQAERDQEDADARIDLQVW